MKTSFILGFVSLLLLASFQIKTGSTITGEIQNHENNTLKLRDPIGKSAWEVPIDIVDGKFSIQFPIDGPAIKNISYGSFYKSIYLHPGQSLQITFDAENVAETFTYGGSLVVENTLLDSVDTKLSDLDYSIAYYQPLDVAKRYLDSLQKDRHHYLNELVRTHNTRPLFKEYMEALITYNYAFFKVMIGERKEEQPEGYYDFLDELAIEKYEYLDIPRYRYFLSEYISMEANNRLDQLESGGDPSSNTLLEESLKIAENLKDERLRDYGRYYLLIYHLYRNGVVGFDKFYEYFQKHNSDPQFAAEFKKAYDKKNLLAPGKPAPTFTMNDVDGKQVSLEDYKGKYVLIDFWQTLCSRSARELPHYLEIYEDYEEENIAFISISVDQNENKWREYVKEKKNVGTSLRALKSWDSEVYQNYQVPGLPTFVLIDPEGRIVNSVAPKPSTQEMRDKLDAVLKK